MLSFDVPPRYLGDGGGGEYQHLANTESSSVKRLSHQWKRTLEAGDPLLMVRLNVVGDQGRKTWR